MKIDCKITENYIKERNRMLNFNDEGECGNVVCCECAFNKAGACVFNMEATNIAKAIEIVQKWSDEHQQMTYVDYLLKHFPNAKLDDDGTPTEICPSSLGLVGMRDEFCTVGDRDCKKCWSKLYEEN